jgi:signal transduction histidine kinase
MALKTNPQQSKLAIHLQKQVDVLIAALKQKNDELTKLKQEKDEFLDIIWEIKAPLSAIKGLAEIISDPNEIIKSEEIAEYTIMIKDAASYISLLTEDFSFVNYVKSPNFRAHLEHTNIVELLQTNIFNYQERAKQKQLELHLILNESSCVAYIDPNLVEQLFNRLISNAIKFSASNKNICIRIIKQKETIRCEIQCEIQDEKQNLNPADYERLASKFKQLNAKPHGREYPEDLGLFIVKKLVEAQQGQVWCESEVGKGATFIVEFPQSK